MTIRKIYLFFVIVTRSNGVEFASNQQLRLARASSVASVNSGTSDQQESNIKNNRQSPANSLDRSSKEK